MSLLFFALVSAVPVSRSMGAPSESVNLVSNGEFAEGIAPWRLNGATASSVVDADAGPFRKALRVVVAPKAGDTVWSAALRQSPEAFLGDGDPLTLKFWGRSPDGCKVTAYVEERDEPWAKSPSETFDLTPEWKEYQVTGECLRDFSPEEYSLGFHLAHGAGTIELTGIRLLDPKLTPDSERARPTADAPQSLIANGDFTQPLDGNWNHGDGVRLKTEVIDADVGGYTKALSIETNPEPGSNVWSVQLGQACQRHVLRGDAIYFRAWLRSPDRCAVSFIYELAEPPNTKSISQHVTLTPEWKEYRFLGRAKQGFRPGQSQAKFFLGHNAGKIEIAGVRVENYGRAPNNMFDQTIDYWGGQEHPDDWRQPALDRIEKIRKGDVTIRVVGADGKPVRGAKVSVQQKRHHFLFGCAGPAARLLDTTDPNNLRFQQEVKRLFNVWTFENDLKWPSMSESRLEQVDRAVDWLHANGIQARGHCLLWGSKKHLHSSIRELKGDTLLKACHDHVFDYGKRMDGKLYLWDVVNEARTNTELWDELGWENFANSFKWAREADPDVLLCYNDYAILDEGGRGSKAREGVKKRIQYLLDNDAPVDRLGLQGHFHLPLTPMHRVLAILDEWAEYGKDLEVTELDLGCSDDKVHGDWIRDFYIAAFSHPSMKAIIMWGFWEGSHWRAKDDGHMINRDWTKRPAQEAYEDLVLNQWWTKADLQTRDDGACTTRAFYGTYALTVEANGKRVEQEWELVPEGDGEVTVKLR